MIEEETNMKSIIEELTSYRVKVEKDVPTIKVENPNKPE